MPRNLCTYTGIDTHDRIESTIFITQKSQDGLTLDWTRLTNCSSPFPEVVPSQRDQSIHGVPSSGNGLVYSLSVPYLRGWTGTFAECTHFVKALHEYMRTHVCTLGRKHLVTIMLMGQERLSKIYLIYINGNCGEVPSQHNIWQHILAFTLSETPGFGTYSLISRRF